MIDWQRSFKKESPLRPPRHSAVEIARMLNVPTESLTMALRQEGAPPHAFINKKRVNSNSHVSVRYYDAKVVIHWYKNIFPLQQQARLQARNERRKEKRNERTTQHAPGDSP